MMRRSVDPITRQVNRMSRYRRMVSDGLGERLGSNNVDLGDIVTQLGAIFENDDSALLLSDIGTGA